MGLLDGDIQALFGSVFGAFYLDATLNRVTLTDNGKGGYTETLVTIPCKGHAPSRSEAYRAAAGFASDEIEIIILQAGVGTAPSTDDRLTFQSVEYEIKQVRPDGAASHWTILAKART